MSEAHLERDKRTLQKRIDRVIKILHRFTTRDDSPGLPLVTRAINRACDVLDGEADEADREETGS